MLDFFSGYALGIIMGIVFCWAWGFVRPKLREPCRTLCLAKLDDRQERAQ